MRRVAEVGPGLLADRGGLLWHLFRQLLPASGVLAAADVQELRYRRDQLRRRERLL
jgi:hypothetical protein